MILKSDRIQNTKYTNWSRHAAGAIGNKQPAISKLIIAFCLLPVLLLFNGCYSFKDVSIPPDVKTFQVDLILNKARYVNPQLSPQITDKLRQKIVNQTRLSPVQENAHYEISATITEYNVSTSGISPNNQGQQTASISRLTVGIQVTLKNTVNPSDAKTNFQANVSRNFDFDANLSLSQAEPQLNETIIKNMVDEMFNRIFSNW